MCSLRVLADTFQRMNASEGLSSVASFSLGLSMSMRGSPVTDEADKTGHQHCYTGPPVNTLRRPIPVVARKPSFQDLFPVQPAAVPPAGGVTKPAAGSKLAVRRRLSNIDASKLARWFPNKTSGLFTRRLSRLWSCRVVGLLCCAVIVRICVHHRLRNRILWI